MGSALASIAVAEQPLPSVRLDGGAVLRPPISLGLGTAHLDVDFGRGTSAEPGVPLGLDSLAVVSNRSRLIHRPSRNHLRARAGDHEAQIPVSWKRALCCWRELPAAGRYDRQFAEVRRAAGFRRAVRYAPISTGGLGNPGSSSIKIRRIARYWVPPPWFKCKGTYDQGLRCCGSILAPILLRPTHV